MRVEPRGEGPRIRFFHAATLDGYVAASDGAIAFLDAFSDVDYGWTRFAAEIATSIVGRRTWEQSRTFAGRAFPGTRTIVLTSRALADAPPGVETRPYDDIRALANDVRGTTRGGDIWIVGGPLAWRAFLDAGEVDRIDHFIVPVLLGEGVAAYAHAAAHLPLELTATESYAKGLVRLTYERG